jgi:hypothetical protein
MQRFPFDEQNCTFVFSSWSYSNDSLTLDFYHDEGFTNNVDWTASTPSAEWDVVSSGAYRNQVIEGGYFCYHNLTYYIIIRRRPGFYLYVLIIPSLLLSILTPGLFWIPPSRPDRTTLGEPSKSFARTHAHTPAHTDIVLFDRKTRNCCCDVIQLLCNFGESLKKKWRCKFICVLKVTTA